MSERVRELDGARFDDLEGFYREVDRVLQPAQQVHNLDALDEALRGALFTLRWTHASHSRQQLGHAETARWLEDHLPRVHPTNRADFEARLREARAGRGETLFEQLVHQLREHVTLELVD